jgi:hypothetical protein
MLCGASVCGWLGYTSIHVSTFRKKPALVGFPRSRLRHGAGDAGPAAFPVEMPRPVLSGRMSLQRERRAEASLPRLTGGCRRDPTPGAKRRGSLDSKRPTVVRGFNSALRWIAGAWRVCQDDTIISGALRHPDG